MLSLMIWLTGALCIGGMLLSLVFYKDVFHPLIYLLGQCAFVYVYMPLRLISDGSLFAYITEGQGEFTQILILLCLAAMMVGCFIGSAKTVKSRVEGPPIPVSRDILTHGAYWIGSIGIFCWLITIAGRGGLTNAFSTAYGMGWSDYGYIREAIYLLIVALLLLLSPEAFNPQDKIWRWAIAILSFPWFVQGLLGARRGPTVVIIATLGMSWYLARRLRPPVLLMFGAGLAVGFLIIFLVTNRAKIYIGSDFDVSTNKMDTFFVANEANEYIFAVGCVTTARETGTYYWGRRYLAQVLVRPIPKQIWPNKYADFGVPELLQNAGVALDGLQLVMGWAEIPGAAATMVADFWVELSWLAIPLCGFIGWGYGYVWRRAVQEQRWWTTLYMILTLLSIYMVTQSGEAVIFRFVILTVPAYAVWRRAQQPVRVPVNASYA
jgi:hypothetical protein